MHNLKNSFVTSISLFFIFSNAMASSYIAFESERNCLDILGHQKEIRPHEIHPSDFHESVSYLSLFKSRRPSHSISSLNELSFGLRPPFTDDAQFEGVIYRQDWENDGNFAFLLAGFNPTLNLLTKITSIHGIPIDVLAAQFYQEDPSDVTTLVFRWHLAEANNHLNKKNLRHHELARKIMNLVKKGRQTLNTEEKFFTGSVNERGIEYQITVSPIPSETPSDLVIPGIDSSIEDAQTLISIRRPDISEHPLRVTLQEVNRIALAGLYPIEVAVEKMILLLE